MPELNHILLRGRAEVLEAEVAESEPVGVLMPLAADAELQRAVGDDDAHLVVGIEASLEGLVGVLTDVDVAIDAVGRAAALGSRVGVERHDAGGATVGVELGNQVLGAVAISLAAIVGACAEEAIDAELIEAIGHAGNLLVHIPIHVVELGHFVLEAGRRAAPACTAGLDFGIVDEEGVVGRFFMRSLLAHQVLLASLLDGGNHVEDVLIGGLFVSTVDEVLSSVVSLFGILGARILGGVEQFDQGVCGLTELFHLDERVLGLTESGVEFVVLGVHLFVRRAEGGHSVEVGHLQSIGNGGKQVVVVVGKILVNLLAECLQIDTDVEAGILQLDVVNGDIAVEAVFFTHQTDDDGVLGHNALDGERLGV